MAAVAFGALAFISGLLTYGAAIGLLPFETTPKTVSILLMISIGFTVALALVIARLIFRLWRQSRKEASGARLHIRIVFLFSIVAVVPSIIVAGFSAATLNLGLQAWFSSRVGSVMENSAIVADAYLQEHRDTIESEARAMRVDLVRALPLLDYNPKRFAEITATQAFVRSLDEAVVFGLVGDVYGRGGRDLDSTSITLPPREALEELKPDDVRVVLDEEQSRVLALTRVGTDNRFLMLARAVDQAVVQHVVRTRSAFDEYRQIEDRRNTIQIGFAVFYILVSLLVLLSAMWMGLWFAGRLVSPISSLIDGASRVRDGDFDARVEGRAADREIETLRRTFNAMTSRLSRQTNELVQANAVLDERRRFTEGVLEGVSAGVVGLDPQRRVTLINLSGCKILGQSDTALLDKALDDVIPQFADLIHEAFDHPGDRIEGDVQLVRHAEIDSAAQRGGAGASINIRVRAQAMIDDDGNITGAIATFDDMTRLVSAQRMAAWGDVARRIAHEIKNPLTPIQLSAERLRRKYRNEFEDDKVFTQCTDTIIRHVGDIGRMVDEFSSFARMPQPVISEEDLGDIAKQAIFLHEVAHTHISFSYDGDEDSPIIVDCDRRLVAQAMTNLLKNAVEAVDARLEADAAANDNPADTDDVIAGAINVSIDVSDLWVDVRVQDNGKGLPTADRSKLTEPYVTTRSKGTGLGLAIVKKVMEDHGGEILLQDNKGGIGATVVLRFPAHQSTQSLSDQAGNVADQALV